MSYILNALVKAERYRLPPGVPSLLAVPGQRRLPSPKPKSWQGRLPGFIFLTGLVAATWLAMGWNDDRHDQPGNVIGPELARQTAAPADQRPAASTASASPGSPVTAGHAGLSLSAPPLSDGRDMPRRTAPAIKETKSAGKLAMVREVVPQASIRKTSVKQTAPTSADDFPPSETTETGPARGIYDITRLPAGLQRTAMNIKVAGTADAHGPAGRMAIVNDRTLREGDELESGIRVERITDDGVVFSLGGYRFRKGRS